MSMYNASQKVLHKETAPEISATHMTRICDAHTNALKLQDAHARARRRDVELFLLG